MTTLTIEETLEERGSRYGKFVDQSVLSQAFKEVMQYGRNWDNLSCDQAEALEMIASKMARILNGDPNYVDNWHDISGYATLVADQLRGVSR